MVVAIGLGAVGCSQPAQVTYALSAGAQQLPAKQQQEIASLLTRLYGTPSHPVLMLPDDSAAPPPETSPAADEPPIRYRARLDADHLQRGSALYQRHCASCHGVTGDGQGPAAEYLYPRPRDYRRGIFKFTSTGRNKPRKVDLVRIVTYGARGTSMPSFRWLSPEEISALVDYVILLAQRGETESRLLVLAEDDELTEQYAGEDALLVYESWRTAAARAIRPATAPPPRTEETIASGRHAFLVEGCAKCHGANGQGYTAEPMQDDWGQRLFAADLTSGMLHGGRRELDVYRRIYSGINGTPMPAFGPEFSPVFQDEPDKIWHLTHYVLALAEGREFPRVTDEEATRMAAEEAERRMPVQSAPGPEAQGQALDAAREAEPAPPPGEEPAPDDARVTDPDAPAEDAPATDEPPTSDEAPVSDDEAGAPETGAETAGAADGP
jgi:mono/diheme cytochrome c family protein